MYHSLLLQLHYSCIMEGTLYVFFPDVLLFFIFYFSLKMMISLFRSIVVAPVAQRYYVTSDTLGREFDPGKRDFSH